MRVPGATAWAAVGVCGRNGRADGLSKFVTLAKRAFPAVRRLNTSVMREQHASGESELPRTDEWPPRCENR